MHAYSIPGSRHLAVWALMTCVMCAGVSAEPLSVFEMPGLHRRHQQLAQQMVGAMRRDDSSEMERACREGVALLPHNAVWRYNLACSLARQGKVTEALETLARAIELGFRDADKIAGSEDLKPLRPTTRFQALVTQARETASEPPEGQTIKRVMPVVDGMALVSESNTLWNLDLGHFQALFALPEHPVSDIVTRGLGEAGERVNQWYREGTAAGNHGDFYDNRDNGHSAIDLDILPQVARIVYAPEAKEREAHWGLANIRYPNAVVVGNSSSARAGDAFWRSIPRMALADGTALALLVQHYADNHLYVYPSHHDFRPGPEGGPGEGDTYFAQTPKLLISRGSSYTDQPLIKSVFLALAAFRPEVKATLRRHHLLMPTVQMLLRWSLVGDDPGYLSRAAHPICFPPDAPDRLRMVEMAQGMTTNRVPPQVQLRMVEEQRMTAGRDFFDVKNAEGLFDTPFALARVVRGMPYERRYTVTAMHSRDLNGLPLTFHWRLLQGDPDRVRIRPRDDDPATADIVLQYHPRFPIEPDSPITSTRVDIGVFAHNGHYFSAPGFVSFFYLDNELRTYHSDGRILSVDYAGARDRYVDPMLSLPRNWRDDYRYTPDGQLLGWMRLAQGVRDYTREGFRVERKDRQGRPLTARAVRYIVRAGEDPRQRPELVEVLDNLRVTYEYDGPDDLFGRIVDPQRLHE